MIFCGIIGYPLKNPRSIKIWKKYFKKKKINCKMIPIEVSPKNFKKKIDFLKKNNNFKAAAITMPYKEKIYKNILSKDNFSKKSKSVNLIVKKKNKIYGYNTDVYGAIETIKNIKKNRILIYGYGGTGKAIFKNLFHIYKNSKFIIISKKKISRKKNVVVSKIINKNHLKSIDLFINCSPRGSNLKNKLLNSSPLQNKEVKFLKNSCTIFDIVYSPKKTKLYFQAKKIILNILMVWA